MVLTALADLVSSQHSQQPTTTCNSSPRGPDALSWPPGFYMNVVHTLTHTLTLAPGGLKKGKESS